MSSALLLILAQRLGRTDLQGLQGSRSTATRTTSCPTATSPRGSGKVTFYKGKGCQTCNFTGMKGRVAIYEVMPVTEDLRTVILKNGTTSEIREMAQTQGMKTLRQSGLMKVIEGTTTVEEVLRVTLST